MSETLKVGEKVVFGTRIGEVREFLPNGQGKRTGPHYVVLPYADGLMQGSGYTEVYPASSVRAAPLDWSPVLGCQGLLQRWSRDPQGGIWQRELVRQEDLPGSTQD